MTSSPATSTSRGFGTFAPQLNRGSQETHAERRAHFRRVQGLTPRSGRAHQHAHYEQHDAPDHPDAELKEAVQIRDKQRLPCPGSTPAAQLQAQELKLAYSVPIEKSRLSPKPLPPGIFRASSSPTQRRSCTATRASSSKKTSYTLSPRVSSTPALLLLIVWAHGLRS
jgi:hypothetical protein